MAYVYKKTYIKYSTYKKLLPMQQNNSSGYWLERTVGFYGSHSNSLMRLMKKVSSSLHHDLHVELYRVLSEKNRTLAPPMNICYEIF